MISNTESAIAYASQQLRLPCTELDKHTLAELLRSLRPRTEREIFAQYMSTSGYATHYREQQCALACLDEWPGFYIRALRGKTTTYFNPSR